MITITVNIEEIALMKLDLQSKQTNVSVGDLVRRAIDIYNLISEPNTKSVIIEGKDGNDRKIIF